jgi:hypothetical protein
MQSRTRTHPLGVIEGNSSQENTKPPTHPHHLTYMSSDTISSNPVAVIFDSGGTATIISNPDLLDKIRPTTPTQFNSIGGAHMVDLIGDLPGIGVAHHSPRLQVNIVSLSQCRSDGHTVHFVPGSIPSADSFHLIAGSSRYVFKKQKSGLFICLFNRITRAKFDGVYHYTVERNLQMYSNQDVKSAKQASLLSTRLGYPPDTLL